MAGCPQHSSVSVEMRRAVGSPLSASGVRVPAGLPGCSGLSGDASAFLAGPAALCGRDQVLLPCVFLDLPHPCPLPHPPRLQKVFEALTLTDRPAG